MSNCVIKNNKFSFNDFYNIYRVQQEVHGVLGTKTDITADDLKNMKYLEKVDLNISS